MNKICVYAPNATIDTWSQKDKKNYPEVNTPKQAKQKSKQLLIKPKIIS